METMNPLISTQDTSASTSLEVVLHPLVLLSISDYITRHTLRRQKCPIVGALLGQQHGRQITIEHAFECLVIEVEGDVILNQSWFEERLQKMKDVHKSPLLDLVGWYTTLPSSGPQSVHLPIHRQILDSYNESALLLGFHPNSVTEESAGGKLPITIYESNFETGETASSNGEDKEMKDGDSNLLLKFKELSFSIETEEAERISIDFVAKGGGNATLYDNPETFSRSTPRDSDSGQVNRTGSKADDKSEREGEQRVLSREEEDLIASITAKVNAIKMLQSRINLIAMYLREFHLSTEVSGSGNSREKTSVDYIMLRSIQALLSRLALLVPSDSTGFEQELLSEQNDVNLISLLSNITQSIREMKETGIKHGFIESSKINKNKTNHSWGGSSHKAVAGVGDLLS